MLFKLVNDKTDTIMAHDTDRRRLLITLASLVVSGNSLAEALLTPTPPQIAGPFYPVKPPLDDDNDLTRVRGQDGIADGQITDLSGHVRDVNGGPVTNARIEIWQCDVNGRYRHPRERGTAAQDPAFQGFGYTLTDPAGRYRFRTIKPVSYPGRTPHIHIAVFPAGGEPFITQLYIKGEARNTGDFLFNRVPAGRRHLVVAGFLPVDSDAVELQAGFDIILDTRDGTPTV